MTTLSDVVQFAEKTLHNVQHYQIVCVTTVVALTTVQSVVFQNNKTAYFGCFTLLRLPISVPV